MTRLFKVVAALALVLAGPAQAQDELLPVEEAFKYVVTDSGSAFEIDWAIYKHAYLYKSRLSFESGTEVIVLGEPELPRGLDHEDEFFGQQEIYRDFFFVRIPYSVNCYPPQTWTATVTLKADSADSAKLQLGAVGGGTSEFPPVDEVFTPELFAVDGNTVELGMQIVPGFYIYKDKLTVRALGDDVQAGRWDLPKGKMKTDEYFGEMEVYLDSFLAELAIARATPSAMTLEL